MLSFFVLLGCTKSGDSYSGVYLLETSFNRSSPIIRNVHTTTANSTNISTAIKTGFLGSCITAKTGTNSTETVCGYTSQILPKYKDQLPSFSLYNELTNSTTQTISLADLNLTLNKGLKGKVGSSTKGEVVILCMLLIVEIIAVGINIASLGFRYTRFSVLCYGVIGVMASISCLLAALSLSWTVVLRKVVGSLITETSMGLLNGKVGGRIERIQWATLLLALLQIPVATFFAWKESRNGDVTEKRDSI